MHDIHEPAGITGILFFLFCAGVLIYTVILSILV